MLRVKLWGTRGTVSTPVAGNSRYGGNTPCVEVRTDDDVLILDAGIGLHWLGESLLADGFSRGEGCAHILVSHTHWAHIQGIPFCNPMLVAGNRFTIYGRGDGDNSLEGLLLGQMDSAFCPVPNFFDDRIGAGITISEIEALEFDIGGTHVIARLVHHVSGAVCLGYRLENGSASLAYIPDVEYLEEDHRGPSLELAAGVDLLIHDAHHTAAEYAPHRGCGHSSDQDAVDLALGAGAGKVLLFHHHPDRDDDGIDAVVTSHRNGDFPVEAAREGEDYVLGADS